MIQFLRKFKIAWLYGRHFPYTDLPEGYWTMENARALSNFLTGDTGVKLRHILRNKANETALRAVMEQTDRSRSLCGYAAGVRGTVAEIDSLLDVANTREGIGMTDEEIQERLANTQ